WQNYLKLFGLVNFKKNICHYLYLYWKVGRPMLLINLVYKFGEY
ncbi:hypothetical protein, partial [uncultured Gammaproteobacteria bacterium]